MAGCEECGGPTEMSVLGEGWVTCKMCGHLAYGEVSSSNADPVANDTPIDEIPDMAGVVIGWRAWKFEVTQEWRIPKLQSVTYSDCIWLPRTACEAKCPMYERRHTSRTPGKWEGHRVPEEDCSCGFYAAESLQRLKDLRYNYYDEEAQRGFFKVIGSVSLWGKVIECSQGYRAELGYPNELYLPYEAHRFVEPLEEAYGCEVYVDNIL